MRIAEGLMSVDELLSFLNGAQADPLAGLTLGAVIVAAFLGGMAMNLTPCVLPMIPVNLIIIGNSVKRGLLYGLGIAAGYGTLGVAAAVGGMAFGAIQSSPWFNAFVAIAFVLLAMAIGGAFDVDFSRFRKRASVGRGMSAVFAFFMGLLSSVLAGACVAPILIAVLMLTANLFARGMIWALALPFVLGIGMAAPWPFLGAGMHFLPKPGAWMKWVNRAFALIVLALALWYGILAYRGFIPNERASAGDTLAATPETFNEVLSKTSRPVLVDCWATWCKNCAAMDRIIADEAVQVRLRGWKIIRLQAENIRELRKVEGFENVRGLPALAIFP